MLISALSAEEIQKKDCWFCWSTPSTYRLFFIIAEYVAIHTHFLLEISDYQALLLICLI